MAIQKVHPEKAPRVNLFPGREMVSLLIIIVIIINSLYRVIQSATIS